MKFATAFIATCLYLATLPVSAQSMYQWKDPQTGNTIYSDQPPPPGIKATGRSNKPGDSGAEGAHSYSVRNAVEKFPVTLFSSADCMEPCVQGRTLLNARGVPFTEKMVQVDGPEINELKKWTGGDAFVPVIVVGQQTFKGFEAGAWTNLLDLAGYPKAAPYGSKKSGAFAQ